MVFAPTGPVYASTSRPFRIRHRGAVEGCAVIDKCFARSVGGVRPAARVRDAGDPVQNVILVAYLVVLRILELEQNFPGYVPKQAPDESES